MTENVAVCMPGQQLAEQQGATDAGIHAKCRSRRLTMTRKKDAIAKAGVWMHNQLFHPCWISSFQSLVSRDIVKPPDMTPSFSLSPLPPPPHSLTTDIRSCMTERPFLIGPCETSTVSSFLWATGPRAS